MANEVKYSINGVTVTAVLNVKGGVQYALGETDGTKIRNQFLVFVMNGTRLTSFLFHDSLAKFEARNNELNESELRNALECFLLDAMAYREANYNAGSYKTALRNFAKENGALEVFDMHPSERTKKDKTQLENLVKSFKACEKENAQLEKIGLTEDKQLAIFDAIREQQEEESNKKYGRSE